MVSDRDILRSFLPVRLIVPEGDVLLHAGDFSNVGLPKDIERFRDFVVALPHPYKVTWLSELILFFDDNSWVLCIGDHCWQP